MKKRSLFGRSDFVINSVHKPSSRSPFCGFSMWNHLILCWRVKRRVWEPRSERLVFLFRGRSSLRCFANPSALDFLRDFEVSASYCGLAMWVFFIYGSAGLSFVWVLFLLGRCGQSRYSDISTAWLRVHSTFASNLISLRSRDCIDERCRSCE